MKWDEFFVTGDPLIYGAMVSIVVASLAILITFGRNQKIWLAMARMAYNCRP